MTKPTLRDVTNETPTPRARARRKPRFEAPAWLSRSGKVAFRRIVLDLELASPGSLERVDVPALAMLSEAYSVVQAAAKAMRGPGNEPAILEVDGVHGGHHRKTPAWQVFSQATARFEALGKEYGVTLGSRLRLELVDAGAGAPPLHDDQDDLDRALGG